MSVVTTHVLDTARGRPGAGIAVTLAVIGHADHWVRLASAATDADGRIKAFFPPGAKPLVPGTYRLRFETGPYHGTEAGAGGVAGFFPYVDVVFAIREVGQHHHVPLLLSPFGYSTYRGS
jgi:5-hydroxyisourate hydrolase